MCVCVCRCCWTWPVWSLRSSSVWRFYWERLQEPSCPSCRPRLVPSSSLTRMQWSAHTHPHTCSQHANVSVLDVQNLFSKNANWRDMIYWLNGCLICMIMVVWMQRIKSSGQEDFDLMSFKVRLQKSSTSMSSCVSLEDMIDVL